MEGISGKDSTGMEGKDKKYSSEMEGSSKKDSTGMEGKTTIIIITIAFLLDTTSSMEDSISSIKAMFRILSQLFDQLKYIKFDVFAFGDYDSTHIELEDVVKQINIDNIEIDLELYMCGSGADHPEAHSSGLFFLINKNYDYIILITDAIPHGFSGLNNCSYLPKADSYSDSDSDFEFELMFDSWDGDVKGISSYEFENNILQSKNYYEIIEDLKKTGSKLFVIHNQPFENITYINLQTNEIIPVKYIWEDFEADYYNDELTELFVTITVLKIISNIIEIDHINIDLKDPSKIFDIFWNLIENPIYLEHLTFLSKSYYHYIKNEKLYDKHGTNVQNFKRQQHSPEILKFLTDFVNKQYNECELISSQQKYPNGPRLVCPTQCDLKDIIDRINSSNFIYISLIVKYYYTINEQSHPSWSRGLPLEELHNNPSSKNLLMGLACKINDGTIPIYYSEDWIMAMCLYIDNPQLKQFLIQKIILQPSFLEWLNENSKRTPPENFWNKIKVEMYCNTFQHINSWLKNRGESNDIINNKTKILKRLVAIMNILKYLKLGLDNAEGIIKGSATQQQRAQFLTVIPMVMCPILGIPFVMSIMFHVSQKKVLEIIENIKKNSEFFSPEDYLYTTIHFEDIIQLSLKQNGLIVSIYAINAHLDNNHEVDIEDPRHNCYRDDFAKISVTSTHKPLTHEKIFEESTFEIQLVNNKDIKEGGPITSVCSRCQCIYLRHDSTSKLDKPRCGLCRPTDNPLSMSDVKCTKCNCSLRTGYPIKNFNHNNCMYCNSDSIEHTIISNKFIPMIQIIKLNLDKFAEFFGIPANILLAILKVQSMAKLFRSDPDDKDTGVPLNYYPEIFDIHNCNWKENINSINENSKILIQIEKKILEMNNQTLIRFIDLINNSFSRICCICMEEPPNQFLENSINQLCINPKNCTAYTCKTCASQLFNLKPGDKIMSQHLSCILCKGYYNFRKSREFIHQNNHHLYRNKEILKKTRAAVDDPHKIAFLCKNPECCNISFVNNRCADGEVSEEQKYCDVCHKKNTKQQKFEQEWPIPGGVIDENGFCVVGDEYYRKCPNPDCGLSSNHDGGCLHMTCSCRQHYCWGCGKGFPDDDSVYNHLEEKCEEEMKEVLEQHPDSEKYDYLYT